MLPISQVVPHRYRFNVIDYLNLWAALHCMPAAGFRCRFQLVKLARLFHLDSYGQFHLGATFHTVSRLGLVWRQSMRRLKIIADWSCMLLIFSDEWRWRRVMRQWNRTASARTDFSGAGSTLNEALWRLVTKQHLLVWRLNCFFVTNLHGNRRPDVCWYWERDRLTAICWWGAMSQKGGWRWANSVHKG